MITVADIRADIRARGFEADTDAQQLAFINSIQRRVAGASRHPWTRTSTTIAVVAGTGDYTLPAAPAGGHVLSVRAANQGVHTPLEWSPAERLLELRARDNGARSTPTAWTLSGVATLALWPTPVGAGTLTVRYHQVPPTLTADADVPLIPLGYRDILSVGAAMLMAMRERQREAVADFKAEFDERCRDLRAQSGVGQQQTPHVVGSSDFYGPWSLREERY